MTKVFCLANNFLLKESFLISLKVIPETLRVENELTYILKIYKK